MPEAGSTHPGKTESSERRLTSSLFGTHDGGRVFLGLGELCAGQLGGLEGRREGGIPVAEGGTYVVLVFLEERGGMLA